MQFASIATEIEAARLLTYNAARLKEEGVSFTKQAAMAKWYSSVIAQKASGSAIEWAGGVGFTRELGIEKYWRDSKVSLVGAKLQTCRSGLLTWGTDTDWSHLRRNVQRAAPDDWKVHHQGALVDQPSQL